MPVAQVTRWPLHQPPSHSGFQGALESHKAREAGEQERERKAVVGKEFTVQMRVPFFLILPYTIAGDLTDWTQCWNDLDPKSETGGRERWLSSLPGEPCSGRLVFQGLNLSPAIC